MCAATVMFSLLNAAAKYLTPAVPVTQLLWARTAGHLVLVVAAFGPRLGRRLFVTGDPVAQLVRSLMLLASTAFNFAALRSVSLATAATINFTAPCMVAALAALLLGERVGTRRWMAIGVGFLGVLVVLRPGVDAVQPGALFALGTAACYALYQVLTRRVAASDPPETTVGYSALVGTVLLTPLVPGSWVAPGSAATALLLASLGLSGGVGHYFVARAYLWGPAALVSPFNYVQLLGAAATGYLIFGDVPGPWLWAGATLIVGSGLVLAYGETRRAGD
jgi:drug/metabolite transporter (DMT)-like permease